MFNINTKPEEVISEILDLSKTLTDLNVDYEVQKPLFDLAQDIYKKEIIEKMKPEDFEKQ